IELYLPASKAFDLTISNIKAKTTINSENIQINNFKYTTQKGSLTFKSGALNGNLELNLGSGDFTVSKDVATNTNDISLKMTTGSFKAPNSVFGDLTITENKRGVISIGACANLRESQKSAGGQITINLVTHANITAGDTIIKINEITNSAIIDLTKSGKVKIDKLTGISSISTNTGSINLDETLSPITLYSESGDINVSRAFYKVSVKANNSSVRINFAYTAESYLSNNDARVLYASIKNGSLTATGVEHVGVASSDTQAILDGGIKITGNGRAHITMQNIYETNSIEGNNGTINIVVNKDSQYVLKTSSAGGSVRVNLTQTSEFGGYRNQELITTYVNCSSSTNSLDVTTNNGSLTILDTNFA
ncbi:MAG: DUF4097 family beta strand repeat protein, partial [Clostridia bacterium]|nr:DUF4097 family beta strand repeat protein [Clostridia bacterium]